MAQRTPEERLALLRQHDDGVPWTRIAAESGVPVRTLSRWAAKYGAFPTSNGLQRLRRADNGSTAVSVSPTSTASSLRTNSPQSWPDDFLLKAMQPMAASPTQPRSRPSSGSPQATSASSTDYSPRSSACRP